MKGASWLQYFPLFKIIVKGIPRNIAVTLLCLQNMIYMYIRNILMYMYQGSNSVFTPLCACKRYMYPNTD